MNGKKSPLKVFTVKKSLECHVGNTTHKEFPSDLWGLASVLRFTSAGPGDAPMRKRLPCFNEENVDGEIGTILATIEGSTGTWNPSGRS